MGEGFSNFGRAWKISLRLFLKYLVPVLIMVAATVGTIIFSAASVFATESLILTPTSSSISTVGSGVMGIVVWIAYLVSFILLIPLVYKYRYAYNEAIMSPESSSKEVVVAAIMSYFYTAAFTMAHVIFYEDKRTQKFGSISAPNAVVENGPAVENNDYTTPIN